VAKLLVVPPNVWLLLLPPCTPELQPAEPLWQLVREVVANHTVGRIDRLPDEPPDAAGDEGEKDDNKAPRPFPNCCQPRRPRSAENTELASVELRAVRKNSVIVCSALRISRVSSATVSRLGRYQTRRPVAHERSTGPCVSTRSQSIGPFSSASLTART